jgi:hypothetical protein
MCLRWAETLGGIYFPQNQEFAIRVERLTDFLGFLVNSNEIVHRSNYKSVVIHSMSESGFRQWYVSIQKSRDFLKAHLIGKRLQLFHLLTQPGQLLLSDLVMFRISGFHIGALQ